MHTNSGSHKGPQSPQSRSFSRRTGSGIPMPAPNRIRLEWALIVLPFHRGDLQKTSLGAKAIWFLCLVTQHLFCGRLPSSGSAIHCLTQRKPLLAWTGCNLQLLEKFSWSRATRAIGFHRARGEAVQMAGAFAPSSWGSLGQGRGSSGWVPPVGATRAD